ncbi:hypothetical protein SNOG_13637 [Parastagonospora nodorum SN15]|uniref:Uncharacterized protein n=1 Tax=Phaeosphaeria nodorum (strain SN15 / ATCC MYA-4574 / FGSC 10173) TaxID=321614 RepID=Q0U3M7_PHANO|nr:hypothetical protein SNOG_13637 [Parastagonospora nodorum SN15]EAT79084.1 hypothetical protein SNOG_13637 [Parastagonospora nodorum SN15]
MPYLHTTSTRESVQSSQQMQTDTIWSASSYNQDEKINTSTSVYRPFPQDVWEDSIVHWIKKHEITLHNTVLLTERKPYDAATRKSDTEVLSHWASTEAKSVSNWHPVSSTIMLFYKVTNMFFRGGPHDFTGRPPNTVPDLLHVTLVYHPETPYQTTYHVYYGRHGADELLIKHVTKMEEGDIKLHLQPYRPPPPTLIFTAQPDTANCVAAQESQTPRSPMMGPHQYSAVLQDLHLAR